VVTAHSEIIHWPFPYRCHPAAIYRGVLGLLISPAWLLQYASWIAPDPNLDVQLRTSRFAALTATCIHRNRCWLMVAHSFSSPPGLPAAKGA
jgi:hypothetical protein